MPATVIAERIGWDRSIRVLSGRVAELRPAYLSPDPASRTCTRVYLPALLVAYRVDAPRVAEVDLSGGAEMELGREPALA